MEIIIKGKQGEGRTIIARRVALDLQALGFEVTLHDEMGVEPEQLAPRPSEWRTFSTWRIPEGSKAIVRVEHTP